MRSNAVFSRKFARSANLSAGTHSCAAPLEIFRRETGVLCNALQHVWADLITFVEREYEIRPAFSRHCFVRARLPFDTPANSLEGRQDTIGLG